MITRYVKIVFVDATFKQIQNIINLVYNLKLYPMSEITYDEITDTYSADEDADLRLFFKPITHDNNSILLYWRSDLDSTAPNNETDVLVNVLDTYVEEYNASYDIQLADINVYSEFVDVRKYVISILEFPEWSVDLVKRV